MGEAREDATMERAIRLGAREGVPIEGAAR